jgi:DNA-binding NarL/FixJ family response regulator
VGIKVVLADDHRILREGLRTLLEKERDIKVVGEAGNGRSTLKLVRDLSPDVVIMDITMPDLNGIEATRQLVEAAPDTKVLALSIHAHRRYVEDMLRAGAIGYLSKDCALEELVEAVHAVAAGKAYLSPAVAGTLVRGYARGKQSSRSPRLSPLVALTARQREVLQLLAEGKTTKQTASALFISTKTVDRHRQQIMQKLCAHSIAELTKYAIREGLTSVEG